MTDGPDMFPYSLSTRRLASSLCGSNLSPASTLSKTARPPGWTAQKRSFQLPPMPSSESASTIHCSMFSRTRDGISLEGWKCNPSSQSWPAATCLLSGIMVCEADSISKSGSSTETGSAPTMTAPAPSPNSDCKMSVSTWASWGARKRVSVTSAQATSTRAPRLFSAMSLARRSAAQPLEQPFM
uniref:Uncharacterized protein n=1 Tax=Zea mays TaxID=4577 RepID=C0P490_MAIZE|nr:unknown [Zea mays]